MTIDDMDTITELTRSIGRMQVVEIVRDVIKHSRAPLVDLERMCDNIEAQHKGIRAIPDQISREDTKPL